MYLNDSVKNKKDSTSHFQLYFIQIVYFENKKDI